MADMDGFDSGNVTLDLSNDRATLLTAMYPTGSAAKGYTFGKDGNGGFAARIEKAESEIEKECFKGNPEGFKQWKEQFAPTKAKAISDAYQYEVAQVIHGAKEDNDLALKSQMSVLRDGCDMTMASAFYTAAAAMEEACDAYKVKMENLSMQEKDFPADTSTPEGRRLAEERALERAAAVKDEMEALNAAREMYNGKVTKALEHTSEFLRAKHKEQYIHAKEVLGRGHEASVAFANVQINKNVKGFVQDIIATNPEFARRILERLDDANATRVKEVDEKGNEVVDEKGNPKFKANVFNPLGRWCLTHGEVKELIASADRQLKEHEMEKVFQAKAEEERRKKEVSDLRGKIGIACEDLRAEMCIDTKKWQELHDAAKQTGDLESVQMVRKARETTLTMHQKALEDIEKAQEKAAKIKAEAEEKEEKRKAEEEKRKAKEEAKKVMEEKAAQVAREYDRFLNSMDREVVRCYKDGDGTVRKDIMLGANALKLRLEALKGDATLGANLKATIAEKIKYVDKIRDDKFNYAAMCVLSDLGVMVDEDATEEMWEQVQGVKDAVRARYPWVAESRDYEVIYENGKPKDDIRFARFKWRDPSDPTHESWSMDGNTVADIVSLARKMMERHVNPFDKNGKMSLELKAVMTNAIREGARRSRRTSSRKGRFMWPDAKYSDAWFWNQMLDRNDKEYTKEFKRIGEDTMNRYFSRSRTRDMGWQPIRRAETYDVLPDEVENSKWDGAVNR